MKKKTLSKILFYGNKSSGKTTFAKLLLKNPLIIEIDENIEIKGMISGHRVTEIYSFAFKNCHIVKTIIISLISIYYSYISINLVLLLILTYNCEIITFII